MIKLQTLDYQTPRMANSPLRQSTSHHASRNGGGLLFLGIAFGVACWLQAILQNNILAVAGAAGIAAWYLIGGILYVIAGVKIIRANPFWERMLVVCSCMHAFVILLVALVAIAAFVQNMPPFVRESQRLAVACLFSLGYLAVHWIAFGRMAYLANKVRNEA